MEKLKSVFINKQFFYLWFAQALSQFATNILLFFAAFVIYKKTSSNIAVSFSLLVYLVPSFVSSILAGVIVDRMGKKWILFLTTLLRAFLVFLMIFVHEHFAFLYMLVFLLALTTQFFTPAESAIMPKIVPEDKLITANAYFATTINLSLILGFLLAPIFFKLFAFKTMFIIFFTYLSAAFLLSFLKLKEPLFYTNFRQTAGDLVKKFKYHLESVFKNFLEDKKISQSVFYIIFLQVALFVLIALSPGFADKILKVPVEDLSFLIIFPTALGFFIASLIVHRFKNTPQEKLRRLSFFMISLFFLIIFFISYQKVRLFFNLLNFLLLAGFGFCSGLVMIIAYAKLQKETIETKRAGFFGLLNAFINLASVIPVFLTGVLSDVFGVNKIMLILSVIFLITALKIKVVDFNNR